MVDRTGYSECRGLHGWSVKVGAKKWERDHQYSAAHVPYPCKRGSRRRVDCTNEQKVQNVHDWQNRFQRKRRETYGGCLKADMAETRPIVNGSSVKCDVNSWASACGSKSYHSGLYEQLDTVLEEPTKHCVSLWRSRHNDALRSAVKPTMRWVGQNISLDECNSETQSDNSSKTLKSFNGAIRFRNSSRRFYLLCATDMYKMLKTCEISGLA